MINMRTHDTGDLIIQFDVEFPMEKSLSDVQLKVSLYEGKPRSSFSFFLAIGNSSTKTNTC